MRKVKQFMVLGALAAGLTGIVGVHVAPASVNASAVDAASADAISVLTRLTWPNLGRLLAEDSLNQEATADYVETWAQLADCTVYRNRGTDPLAWDTSLATARYNFGAFEGERRFTVPVQVTMGAYDEKTGRLALTQIARPKDLEFKTRAVVKGAPGMWCPDVTIEAFRTKQDAGLPRRFELNLVDQPADLSIQMSKRDVEILRRNHADNLLPATMVVQIDGVEAPDFAGISRVVAKAGAVHVYADATRTTALAILADKS